MKCKKTFLHIIGSQRIKYLSKYNQGSTKLFTEKHKMLKSAKDLNKSNDILFMDWKT